MDDDSTKTEQAVESKEAESKPEVVPKERMDEVAAENARLKEQNDLLQQNQALIQANAQQVAPQKQIDPWEEAGLDPKDETDIPNQGQQKKILGRIIGRVNSEIAELRFKVDHPDYSQIVGTADQIRTGQFAEPLAKAIKANPALMATIQNSRDPMAAAYAIAKQQANKTASGDTTKTTKTEAEAAIDEAVQNAKTVKTSANAKGGDGLSEEGRAANMTDSEFLKAFNAAGGDL